MVELGGKAELHQRLDERAGDEDHVVTGAAACRYLAHDLFIGRMQRQLRLDAGLLGEVLEEIGRHVGVPVGNDDFVGSLRRAERCREAEERGCSPPCQCQHRIGLLYVPESRPLSLGAPNARPSAQARRRAGHCDRHYMRPEPAGGRSSIAGAEGRADGSAAGWRSGRARRRAQACGSTTLSLAVPMRVYITAARSPLRSEPAKSKDRRP